MAKNIRPEGSRIKFKDLRGYLSLLEAGGLLKRVKAEVDLKHEIGAICVKSLKRRGPGLLFENIKGYKGMPLVTNILSRTEQLAVAFGTEADHLKIYEVIHEAKSVPISPRIVEEAPCQEEIHVGDDVDVYEFPTPWWHELDAGQYIGTTAGVITVDPDTGYLNLGMYRAMIKDKNTLSLNIRGPHAVGEDPNKRGKRYGGHTQILKHEVQGKSVPISIAIGMDPLLTFVAAQAAPSDKVEHAEYALVGSWRGEPVELVKCKTNDLLVPAWAEIILEGEVLLNQRTIDGPHGERDGFYRRNNQAFVMRIKCITHRKNPINYGLICAPHEDYPKFIFSAGLRAALEGVSCIKEVYVPEMGGGLMAIVSATVRSPGDVEKVIKSVHTVPEEYNISRKPRWLIIVDDDCDVNDWEDVLWRVVRGVMPDKDVRIGPRTDRIVQEALADVYNAKASSIVIDATVRSKEAFPPINKVSRDLMSRIEARWKEYGI